ncbi:MAG: hypothetical protein QNJ05_02220 [Woeseiaceae bacterium]|nr:hypothetical protein [Woeseiaceae bacterium]
MTREKTTTLPPAAQWTGLAALAACPLGWLFGMILSAYEDPTSAAYVIVFGLGIGAIASLILGLIHWYCRKERRVALLRRHRRALLVAAAVILLAITAWYVQPAFEDQRYSLRVHNFSGKDMSSVEVRFLNETIEIGPLAARAEIELHGFSEKPSGFVRVTWVESANEATHVPERYRIGAPRRFDGGTLSIGIFSRRDVSARFLPARADEPVGD